MKWISTIVLSWIAACCAQGASFAFQQTWGYLMKGEESYLDGSEPITDLAYFSAQVNDVGRLSDPPAGPVLPGRLKAARTHLVISAPASRTLMYLVLARDAQIRGALLQDILAASAAYDGVQIDFEAMRAEEGPAYLSFLAELKRRLPAGRTLSVAVPARTRVLDDAFSYAGIAAVADRVVVMAYDEHWRTGSPGAIASAAWCRQVATFAKTRIPAAKLVMGLPLYGRVWQTDEVARALKYPETLQLWEQDRPPLKRLEDQTPFFEFTRQVHAAAYFEDLRSLAEKLSLYQDTGIQAVAFWRIGQGPAALWKQVRAK